MRRPDEAKPSMRWSLAATLGWTVFAASLTACSLDWSFSYEDAGSRSDASDASFGGDRVAPPDSGSDGTTSGDSAPPADASIDVPAEGSGGCHSNAECASSSFCHYPDHRCGQGAGGVCIPRPSSTSCPVSTPYACTCAGNVDVTGPCGAETAGNDVSILPCPSPPPGSACGYVYCVTPCVQGSIGGETTYDCQ